MNRQEILREMKISIGTQAPIVFFEKMTELLSMMFDHIEKLETNVTRLKAQMPLAIQWEPKLASDMLAKEILSLKKLDKETYAIEIAALQRAYADDRITQEYADFCKFWQDTLGWHPFLDY